MNSVKDFEAPGDAPPRDDRKRRRPSVLVVEDELQVLEAVSIMLRDLGYAAVPAETGARAVEAVQEHPEGFSLAIVDMCLPDMLGDRLCAELARLSPDLRIVFASGYPLDERMRGLLDAPGRAFIRKPYSKLLLSMTIDAILPAD